MQARSDRWTLMFLNFYRYRAVIIALSIRELRVRYKGSVLGFFWTFLSPLLTMAIYSIVFRSMMRSQLEHYPVYVFSGILLWNAISGAINDGASALAANASLVTKSALPPEVIPARVVLTQFFNYLLTIPLLFVFSFVGGVHLGWSVWGILLVIPLCFAFVFSTVLGLSVLGAVFRDVQYLVNTLIFALFFTVPVMYPLENLPPNIRSLLSLSPFTVLIKMNADVWFFGRMLELGDVLYILAWIAGTLFISTRLFWKFRSRIAERL